LGKEFEIFHGKFQANTDRKILYGLEFPFLHDMSVFYIILIVSNDHFLISCYFGSIAREFPSTFSPLAIITASSVSKQLLFFSKGHIKEK
jgi:hypothetical protein